MVKVSFIMGIYNCEKTLQASIDSIIRQTYTNWELIMCDDASKDNTYNIAIEYASKYQNITVIKNDTNQGLNYTLNRCLKYAKGEYIARQDGDDISMPERLEKQVKFLDENPEYALISSWMTHFDENGEWGIWKQPERPDKMDFLSRPPFCHAAAVIRKSVFDEVQGYSINKFLLRVEDYNLWFKIYAKGYKGYNLQEALYKMRDDRSAFLRRKYKYRINEAYVKIDGFKKLKIPFRYYIYVARPLLVGVLPGIIYHKLHKLKLN